MKKPAKSFDKYQKDCAITSLRVISTVVKYDTPNLVFFHFGWKPEQFRGKRRGGRVQIQNTNIHHKHKKSKFKNGLPKGLFPDMIYFNILNY